MRSVLIPMRTNAMTGGAKNTYRANKFRNKNINLSKTYTAL